MTANLLPRPGLGKFRVEYMPGRGYRVMSPDREPVGCYHNTRDAAETACTLAQHRADLAKKRKVRPCLCCRTLFQSEGAHNRMCGSCRNRASNDEEVPFSFGAIHGRKRA